MLVLIHNKQVKKLLMLKFEDNFCSWLKLYPVYEQKQHNKNYFTKKKNIISNSFEHKLSITLVGHSEKTKLYKLNSCVD